MGRIQAKGYLGVNRRGTVVHVGQEPFVAIRDTSSSPPGDDWRPPILKSSEWDELGPIGPKGEPGRDGKDAPPARDGRDGVDGRGLDWRGEWKRRTAYSENDVVEHDGSSWICVTDSTRTEPSENSSHWNLVAAKGERGEQGEHGIGQRGRRGADGQTIVIPTDPFGTQTAQAFFDSAAVRGSVVRVSGDKHVDLALAHGSDAAALAVGLAVANTEADGFGSYVTGGPFTNEAWNLTPGACYYLSPTNPGEITDVYPNTIGDFVVILGIALTPKTLSIKIEWALYVGS